MNNLYCCSKIPYIVGNCVWAEEGEGEVEKTDEAKEEEEEEGVDAVREEEVAEEEEEKDGLQSSWTCV